MLWKDPDKIENSNLITKCFNSLVERYINFWQDCMMTLVAQIDYNPMAVTN